MPISAGAAEAVCESIRREIAVEETKEPGVRFDRLLATKDREMVTLLNQVWFGLPESMDSRSLDGFGVLCDLCSEGGVLYEDDEELPE